MGETRDILLVEDDERLGAEVHASLTGAGYDVEWMTSGTDALWVEPESYRLIILDLMLPGQHGFDLLKQYRERSDVPVIILTARKDTFDKVRGFELGGDDYVTKPFWPEELLARVSARLRRPVMRRAAGIAIGPLEIDTEARELRLDGEFVELTKVEFDVLAQLAARPNMAITRRQLVDRALDEEREGTERTLDVHISRIRKKLGAASKHLATVWGVGYKLVESLEDH
ncbi:MAG: response regulator transcription factor [Myxococcota bacterium]